MSIGWDDVQRMKRIEARANDLGLKFDSSPYSWSPGESQSSIYLKPKDDCLPHYSRDATIFSGTLEEIENWIKGVDWARNYDDLLKLSTIKKRAAREDAERQKQLMKTIKTGKLVSGKLGNQFDNDITINIDPSTYGHNDYAACILADLYSNDPIKL